VSRSAAIEAIVFDMDGVLIDSERTWEAARKALVVQSGRPYPPEATRAIMGMSAPEWARYLQHELGVDLPEAQIQGAVVARVAHDLREHLDLMPGAVACVRAVAAHWPLAIASSANHALIELVLDLAGLRDAFRVVVGAEEVARGKPSPDVYLRACELLGADPRRSVAVEDSSNGIRSGHAAGMRVIAIPNRDFPPAPDALALADAVLSDLSELTPERLTGAE
jgi:HAD superfamily hydrolase (TIGR01509 family)